MCQVVVNGSTVAPLLSRLGMDTLSDERKFMLQYATRKLDVDASRAISSHRSDKFMAAADWSLVREKYLFRKAFRAERVQDPEAAAALQALIA